MSDIEINVGDTENDIRDRASFVKGQIGQGASFTRAFTMLCERLADAQIASDPEVGDFSVDEKNQIRESLIKTLKQMYASEIKKQRSQRSQKSAPHSLRY